MSYLLPGYETVGGSTVGYTVKSPASSFAVIFQNPQDDTGTAVPQTADGLGD